MKVKDYHMALLNTYRSIVASYGYIYKSVVASRSNLHFNF